MGHKMWPYHRCDKISYESSEKLKKKVDKDRLRCDPKDDSLYVSNKNESLEQNFNG